RRSCVLFCPRDGLELFRSPRSRRPPPGRKGVPGRRGRVHGQSSVGQDHHVSYHRHGDGLHRELRGGPRRCHGGGSVSLRLRGRPLRLSRPREALGLLWLAQRAHHRFADGDKPPPTATFTPLPPASPTPPPTPSPHHSL